MVSGVANVWVLARDVGRLLDFYENTPGFSLVKRDGPWAEIDASGLNIGINGPRAAGRLMSGLDSAVEDLKGVEFPAEISEHDRGRVATFKDTEGNDLQLYEPPNS